MARYIDADKLCEALKSMASVQYPDKQSTILGVVSSIENFPSADVAPKSEVDNWYCLYHSIKEELKQEKIYHRETENLCDRYCIESQQAKKQVAREIFEEIGNAMCKTYNAVQLDAHLWRMYGDMDEYPLKGWEKRLISSRDKEDDRRC